VRGRVLNQRSKLDPNANVVAAYFIARTQVRPGVVHLSRLVPNDVTIMRWIERAFFRNR
jgi:hypothetical protein